MALMSDSCPGSRLIRSPMPEDIICIHCGAEVEIWSFEAITHCPACGQVVCRTQGASCLDWCAAAKTCVGEAAYARIMAEREAARDAMQKQQDEKENPRSS
jgi:predicted RNA-binding Zn-ribbon protein involved in translation (DUF1610 family)